MSRAKVAAIFTDADLGDIASAVSKVGLNNGQRERFAEVLGLANEPPLMTRFRAALVSDGVPFTEEEVQALGRLRRSRNKALHGDTRLPPAAEDLDLGKALVNRMLCFRAWRSASG